MNEGRINLGWIDKHLDVIFILPLVIMMVGLVAYPLFFSIQLSLTNSSLMRPTAKFIMLRNYVEVCLDERFWAALVRSVIWTVGCISLQLAYGLAAALLLNQDIRGKGVFQVLLILPWTLPSVAFVQIWKWMLDPMGGIVNHLLYSLGVIPTYWSWFSKPHTAMGSVIWTYGWFAFPYVMVSILAGLKAIPQTHYDVAKVEGASALQTFRYVTFPYIRGIISIILIIRTIWVFNKFAIIFLATGGGPGDVTRTLPVLAYETGWQRFLIGKAAAITGLMLVFLTIALFFYLKTVKFVEE